MNYYILAVVENGQWVCEFGDYDKSLVKAEKDECFRGVKTKLIRCTDEQSHIKEVISKLNAR